MLICNKFSLRLVFLIYVFNTFYNAFSHEKREKYVYVNDTRRLCTYIHTCYLSLMEKDSKF